jgi:ParB-like chromosome segregation protein Spo0J
VQDAFVFPNKNICVWKVSNDDEKKERAMEPDLTWIKNHPVSNVIWVPAELVRANDYNPNTVAPPEMKLLKISIESDGFTQPIVVWQTEDEYEVVDGFHRYRVGKALGMSHLPVVIVNRTGKGDRIASTIRHNRARGKHSVGGMSDIVLELSRRNWSDARIGRELGMEPDEVLRLKQVRGLAEMYSDKEFSEAWEPG